MNFWIIVFDLFVWLSVLATVYLVGWMVYDLWHTRARWPGATPEPDLKKLIKKQARRCRAARKLKNRSASL